MKSGYWRLAIIWTLSLFLSLPWAGDIIIIGIITIKIEISMKMMMMIMMMIMRSLPQSATSVHLPHPPQMPSEFIILNIIIIVIIFIIITTIIITITTILVMTIMMMIRLGSQQAAELGSLLQCFSSR